MHSHLVVAKLVTLQYDVLLLLEVRAAQPQHAAVQGRPPRALAPPPSLPSAPGRFVVWVLLMAQGQLLGGYPPVPIVAAIRSCFSWADD